MTTQTQTELPPQYRPEEVEPRIFERWQNAGAFHAEPADGGDPYSIVIPPPNVTAPLHLGHALNNTLQDILIRWRRMVGDNTMWMPGTDHAGIATQTVVEKRVLLEEGKKRTDFERDAFIARIQAWKDEYEQRITDQLREMGCSCDWDRQRFTMDDVCAKAVREAFFRLFKDGLIYRGKRLVNWDPVTQTALADDEVEMQEVDGNFYYLRYPLIGPPLSNGENYVTVATTRPETMLGDTAVAVNPADPRAAELRGRCVLLPIVNREIPIIEDDYVVLPDPDSDDAKARYASGFLKVTPAHDPNDWEIGQRQNLDIINVMAPDASISNDHGWPAEDWQRDTNEAAFLLGKSREEARKLVVQFFKDHRMMGEVKPYRHAVGHSYRSHVPIEPYLSDQWYLKVTDGRLRGAALRALSPDQRTDDTDSRDRKVAGPRGLPPAANDWEGQLHFHPQRYARTYETWLENLRDWCISRQLWWGHRIPVWRKRVFLTEENWTEEICGNAGLDHIINPGKNVLGIVNITLRSTNTKTPIAFTDDGDSGTAVAIVRTADGMLHDLSKDPLMPVVPDTEGEYDIYVCCRNDRDGEYFTQYGYQQDPDVLDTWFSSALWPLSTMGWPQVEGNDVLATWNPTNVLCTAREIITLWVVRMVQFNLYFHDRLPFKNVFIHAMIQDGFGQKMSKSLGNGVDPMDLIHSHGADAMRFTLAAMTTHTQDVRMPVDIIDPHTPGNGELIHPKFITTKSGYKVAAPIQEHNGRKCVTSYGVASGEAAPTDEMPLARNTSEKFDRGQRFANKLWNAVRFSLESLCVEETHGLQSVGFSVADRWVLSRTVRTLEQVNKALEAYEFHQYAGTLDQFVWNDLCDWYIESVKPIIQKPQGARSRQVLATVLDVSLRMLHPAMPFITEKLWEALSAAAPKRGVKGLDPHEHDLLMDADWPVADRAVIDLPAEEQFARLQEVVTMIREVRSANDIHPRKVVEFSLKMDESLAAQLSHELQLVETLTNTKIVAIGADVQKPDDAAVIVRPAAEGYLHHAVDADAERQRLSKRLAELDKSIKTMNGRLSNKKYVDKAPAHLVQQTRDQLAAAEREREAIRQQLDAL